MNNAPRKAPSLEPKVVDGQIRKGFMKTVIFVYAIGLLIIRMSATAAAGDFQYTLHGNKAIVTGYTGGDKHIVVPDTLDGYPVTMIGIAAFHKNVDMVTITLPGTVVGFGDAAFRDCAGLSRIALPDSLGFVGYQVFVGCASLTNIYVGANNAFFTSIDGVLFDKTATTLIQYPSGRQQPMYSVPDGVKTIGHGAFHGASGLTAIKLPDSVTDIGDSAFRGCANLTDIILPDGITMIGDSAFHGCKKLVGITIPESIPGVGWAAFQNCTSLSRVTIKPGVRNLGGLIFSGCSSLTEIHIPGSVVTIGNQAFDDCVSMTSIQVARDNTHFTDNNGVLFHTDTRTLIQYPLGRSGSYRVPNGVVHIAGKAFYGCVGLTEVCLPDSVAGIGNDAFRDCINLERVYRDDNQVETGDVEFLAGIPATTISDRDRNRIGDAAFRGCVKLKTMTLPNSVTSIGDSAFQDCGKLEAIHMSEGITSLGDSAFRKCSNLTQITLPGSLTHIGRTAFFYCSALQEITVADENEAFASVDGVIYDAAMKRLVQYPPGRRGHYTMIPHGVDEIGSIAFGSARQLTGVTIPQSVRTIGRSAFVIGSSLEGLYFKGDKPKIAPDAIQGNVTLYYRNGTHGWDVETSQLSVALWTSFPDPMDPGKEK